MTTEQTAIVRATADDLDTLAPLFDAYRAFYRCAPDSAGARAFLQERLERDESVVFLARDEHGQAVGFAQLYAQFSALGLKRNWLLADLFVAPEARLHGAGAALLRASEDFARSEGAATIALETAVGNRVAHRFYEANGWLREHAWYQYSRPLN